MNDQQPSLTAWINRIAWTLLAAFFGGAVAWGNWITLSYLELRAKSERLTTPDEVVKLVQNYAPYIADRKFLQDAIKTSREAVTNAQQVNKELKQAIDNNTRAIIKLESNLDRFRPVNSSVTSRQ